MACVGMSTAPCSAFMLGTRVAQTLLIDCSHRFVRKVTTTSTLKSKQANTWARSSALALAVKLQVATNLRSSPKAYSYAAKPLIFKIHKYCLFSALLSTWLSSTLCGRYFSTWCHWCVLLLTVQCVSVSRIKCGWLRGGL